MPHAEATRRLGDALPDAAGRDTFIAAMRLRTRSLADTASLLGRRARDAQVIVPAAAACNVALIFM
jgi:hypothetical protein